MAPNFWKPRDLQILANKDWSKSLLVLSDVKDAITMLSVSTEHEEPPKEQTGGKGVKSSLLIKPYSKLHTNPK